MTLRWSQLKEFLVVLTPLVFLVGVISFLFYSREVRLSLEHIKEQEKSKLVMRSQLIDQRLHTIMDDLAILSSYHGLQHILAAETEEKDSLQNEFLAFCRYNNKYDQVRLLDHIGNELIRVNNNNGTAAVVPKDQLQFKGDRYYFQKSIVLPPGEIYISPFDLNIENSEIEIPVKPMLRFAMPVVLKQNGHDVLGIVMLNYLGQEIINSLETYTAGSSRIPMLLNNDGYWLKGRTTSEEWGFMYEDRKEQTFSNRYPGVWQKILQNATGQEVMPEQGIFTYRHIPLHKKVTDLHSNKNSFHSVHESLPSDKRKTWVIVSHLGHEFLQAHRGAIIQKIFLTDLILLFFVTLTSVFIAIGREKTRRAQEAIRIAEHEWKITFDAASDSIILLDGQHQIIKANKATAALFGFAPEKMVGQKCYNWVHGTDCPPEICPLQKVMSEGIPHTFTTFADHLGKYLLISISPIFNSHGQVTKVVHITHDITPLKHKEKQIASLNLLHEELIFPRELGEKLQLITDNAATIFKASLCRIWLAKPEGPCDHDCVHSCVEQEEFRCQDTSKFLHLMASSGQYHHVDGKDHILVPIGCDEIGKIASGETPKFISNDVVHDQRFHNHQWAKEHSLVSFAGYSLLSATRTPLGVLGLFSTHPITSEIDNMLMGLVNTTTHIIIQAQLDQELQKSKAFFENIFNESIPICITDLEHNIIQVNDSYVSHFGSHLLNGNPLPCYESRPGPSCQTARCPLVKIKNGAKEVVCESSKKLPNGAEHNFIVTARPFLGPNGTLRGIHESFQDITEHKKLEKELVKMHNLEALGHLAGGIAHDFNNLMTAVLGNIEISKMLIPPDSKALPMLENATEASIQTKKLTSKLLTFSKGGYPFKQETDLGLVIEESGRALFPPCESGETETCSLTPNNITYNLNLAKDLWRVSIDREQIKKTLHHILLNAQEALPPHGGEISVTAINETLSPKNSQHLQEGEYVLITIHDNGRVIPETMLPMIFNPYFSTKNMASQKGVGLGLAICLSIINKHEGHIAVESSQGKGTTIFIYLPVNTEKMKPRENLQKKVPSPTEKIGDKKGNILILEDEPYVFEVTRMMLEKLGYTYQWAKEGNKAIELYKQAMEDDTPFDAVIFDLTIKNGLGGKEAFEQLRRHDPDIKGIVASGYADDPAMTNPLDYGFKIAMAKPYVLQEFDAVLKRIL